MEKTQPHAHVPNKKDKFALAIHPNQNYSTHTTQNNNNLGHFQPPSPPPNIKLVTTTPTTNHPRTRILHTPVWSEH